MNGRYRVIWRQRVIERQLAAAVVRAMEQGEDVAAINSAVDEIDRTLASTPLSVGESRGDYQRVFVAPPLSALYEVLEDESVVFIVGLRYRPIPHSDE